MFDDPYVNRKGSFSHPDWEHDDPRIHRREGTGAFIGAVVGLVLVIAVVMAVVVMSAVGPSTPVTPPSAQLDYPVQ